MKTFVVGCIFSVFSLIAFAAPATSALPKSKEEAGDYYAYLGQLVGRVVQTGYTLEILTNEQCTAFAERKHFAADDIAKVVAQLPGELRRDRAALDGLFQVSKENAVKEIAQWNEMLDTNRASAEFRCGVLLGITSTTYYQARRDWAQFYGADVVPYKLP